MPVRSIALIVAVLLAIIAPFLLFGGAVDAWAGGVIARAESNRLLTGGLLALLLASDILMPVPSSLVSTACGMTLGFWGGTCASFAGMSVTALAGYCIGRYAAPSAARLIGAREAALLRDFHRRHGVWLLLVLRPVPVLAEASVVFSGVSRLPAGRVAAVTALGNLVVSAVYAAVGVWGSLSDSFIPAFLASMGLSGAMIAVMRMRRDRHGMDGGTTNEHA
jgi:uncharacterized membrane protein YdjX (TVP38/TMEM64 family)